jgi:hypothetical protein
MPFRLTVSDFTLSVVACCWLVYGLARGCGGLLLFMDSLVAVVVGLHF